jgi:plasmid stabilization system protein ParE
MSAKRIEIHPDALTELKAALGWFMQRSQAAASNFASAVDHAIDLIAQAPRRWPIGEHDTRKFALQRFPYAVVYRERDNSIQLLAVAHGSRRPEYWKSRL